MSVRSFVTGGAAPTTSINMPVTADDGYALTYSATDGELQFSAEPIVGKMAIAAGSTLSFTETGGAGVLQDVTIQAYSFALDTGGTLRKITLKCEGPVTDSTAFDGGGAEIQATLPAGLEAAADVSLVGVTQVTDTAATYVAAVEVSGTDIKIRIYGSNLAAGATSMQGFTVSYYAVPAP